MKHKIPCFSKRPLSRIQVKNHVRKSTASAVGTNRTRGWGYSNASAIVGCRKQCLWEEQSISHYGIVVFLPSVHLSENVPNLHVFFQCLDEQSTNNKIYPLYVQWPLRLISFYFLLLKVTCSGWLIYNHQIKLALIISSEKLGIR